MSVNGINGSSFDFSKLLGNKATKPAAGSAGAVNFSSELKLQIANIEAQTVGSLVSSGLGSSKGLGVTNFADILGAGKTTSTSSLEALLSSAAGCLLYTSSGIPGRFCFLPNSNQWRLTPFKARLKAFKSLAAKN